MQQNKYRKKLVKICTNTFMIVDLYEQNITNQHCQLDKHLYNLSCVIGVATAKGNQPENPPSKQQNPLSLSHGRTVTSRNAPFLSSAADSSRGSDPSSHLSGLPTNAHMRTHSHTCAVTSQPADPMIRQLKWSNVRRARRSESHHQQSDASAPLPPPPPLTSQLNRCFWIS